MAAKLARAASGAASFTLAFSFSPPLSSPVSLRESGGLRAALKLHRCRRERSVCPARVSPVIMRKRALSIIFFFEGGVVCWIVCEER